MWLRYSTHFYPHPSHHEANWRESTCPPRWKMLILVLNMVVGSFTEAKRNKTLFSALFRLPAFRPKYWAFFRAAPSDMSVRLTLSMMEIVNREWLCSGRWLEYGQWSISTNKHPKHLSENIPSRSNISIFNKVHLWRVVTLKKAQIRFP